MTDDNDGFHMTIKGTEPANISPEFQQILAEAMLSQIRGQGSYCVAGQTVKDIKTIDPKEQEMYPSLDEYFDEDIKQSRLDLDQPDHLIIEEIKTWLLKEHETYRFDYSSPKH